MRNLQSEAKLRDDVLKRQLMEVLRQHFRPEFLNRIDEIIIFHALDRDQIQDIVRLQLEQVRRAAEGQGIQLSFDDSLVQHLAEEGYQPEYGARELRRQIRQKVETKLASEMLRGTIREGDSVTLRYDASSDSVAIAEPVGVK
jgi:ATP-dependent Clp protease ATP-binding subunit ClpC